MTEQECRSFTAHIFVAGDIEAAKEICAQYVECGWCVSVSACDFFYTGGNEPGIDVCCINYARFPEDYAHITEKAKELARRLIAGLAQQSASVVTDFQSFYITQGDAR